MKKRILISVTVIICVLLTGLFIGIFMNRSDLGNGENREGNEEPSITVWTKFPEGTVTSPGVDITYTAIPGRDATVEQVYYVINDSDGESCKQEIIYVSDDNNLGYSPKGELGKGRVLLFPEEENYIVFTVKDSKGRTAQFIVEEHPYYQYEDMPEIDYSKFRLSQQMKERKYLPDLLILSAENGVSRKEVQKMAESIGGEIIGWSFGDKYYVQVPESTEEELEAMCVRLENKYKKKLSYVDIYYIGGFTLD